MTQEEPILFLSFNSDISCFLIGTDYGFRIFNTLPLQLCIRRDFPGGLGVVELLNRSNLLALVGGGQTPRYPANKVIFWDERTQSARGELGLSDQIKNVKLCGDICVIVLEEKVNLYTVQNLELFDTINTYPNQLGVVAIHFQELLKIAVPDIDQGSVVIKECQSMVQHIIKAHKTVIAALSFNQQGTILATASEIGTTIRLFSLNTLQRIREFRRGLDRADIFSIAFNRDSNWLACTSDKGTVHVFCLNQSNPQSKFKFLGKYLNYFNSEWSYCQLRISINKSICAFGQDNSIIVIDNSGMYYRGRLNSESGGDCELLERQSIFEFI